jgi:hypothetical protein
VAVSDEKNPKIIGAEIELTACDRGGMHVTNIRPITDAALIYDAPDADRVLASSKTFGWTSARTWNKNWDTTFGDTPEPELN